VLDSSAHPSEISHEIGKNKKTLIECFQLLKECMMIMQVFEWHKEFMEGREKVEDEHLGHPSASKTEENVEKISEIVDLRVKRLIKSTTWRS
jgi:hypothetical protein